MDSDSSPTPDRDTPHDPHESRRTEALHAVRSFLLALAIVGVAIVGVIVLVATKPEPEKKTQAELVPAVRVSELKSGSHAVRISTQGVVRSLREVTLSAEVGGRVFRKSPSLIDGGAVEAGEVLVEIEPADYRAARARADSAVADARVAVAQEQALAEQALADWRKLGRGDPGDLVLRKPQLAAAEARLESALAELRRASRDVERTSICAPFNARVRRVSVEQGAVLAPGTPVADLYSVDELEVRLPFPLSDYGYLKTDGSTRITLSATVGGEARSWPAVLDRIDGEIDRATLSGYGMARVRPDAAGLLPPVGLFVEAQVPGKVLEEVVELPRAAVRGDNEVWVVQQGRLARRTVEVLRAGSGTLVVRGDFAPGDQLMLTRLAAPLAGMKVDMVEVDSDEP